LRDISEAKRKVAGIALIWVALILAPGCRKVGPDPAAPPSTLPDAWNLRPPNGTSLSPLDLAAIGTWWTSLGDPGLTSLIDRALANNLDLKKAVARISEARAQWGVATGREYPGIDAGASVTRNQISRNALGNLESTPILGKTLVDSLSEPTTTYGAGVNASWEMDLFGRIRRQTESAEANLQASVEDLRDIRVSLLGEVGRAYTEVRSCQARLALTQAALQTQASTVNLIRVSLDQGEGSRLELEQAQTDLGLSRAGLPPLNTGLAQAEHRLEALLGLPPGALRDELSPFKPIPMVPAAVALGIPAELLRQRPDVRRAEQQYEAQTAQIGVATADKYPRLNWGGTIGLESISSGNLLSQGSRVFGIGPTVTWNVFDAGRIRQNVRIMDARQEQALIAFEASVLKALHEVEDVLAAYGDDQIRRQALLEAEQGAQRTLAINQDLFDGGEGNLLGVLSAQRALQDLQIQRIQSDAAVTTDVIRLSAALGGGWVRPEPAPPAQAH
jgi:NodT family efflux transporter outer membrane factor (OMF) lipoprotein